MHPSIKFTCGTLDTHDAPTSISCHALVQSRNIPVLYHDDDDDGGNQEDIVYEVFVKMLKGPPNKLTIDMISLDMMDWDAHAQHGPCWKIDCDHVNDLILATYKGQDFGPVDCLQKYCGSMSCTLCLCHMFDMQQS